MKLTNTKLRELRLGGANATFMGTQNAFIKENAMISKSHFYFIGSVFLYSGHSVNHLYILDLSITFISLMFN